MLQGIEMFSLLIIGGGAAASLLEEGSIEFFKAFTHNEDDLKQGNSEIITTIKYKSLN